MLADEGDHGTGEEGEGDAEEDALGENELVELFAEGGHHYGEDGAEGADAEEELEGILVEELCSK